MFIIEGSDNLGKTTAAKRMVELAKTAHYSVKTSDSSPKGIQAMSPVRYPVRYQHMSRQNSSFDYLNDYTEMMSKYAVQDRFHLGGIVWHNDVITPHSLRIIQGRLFSLASVVCVFYASDEAWFRKQQTVEPGKDEMYHADVRIKANRRFKELADGGMGASVDITYDVSQGFPDDLVLKMWLGYWFDRLYYLER